MRTLDDVRREYDQGDPAAEYGPDGCNAWGDDPDDPDDDGWDDEKITAGTPPRTTTYERSTR